jgi:hypothetical protein
LADLHRSGVDLEGTLTTLKLSGGSDHNFSVGQNIDIALTLLTLV